VSQIITPVSRLLRGVHGEFYIVREVAEKTGISESAIRRAIRDQVTEMMPSKTTSNGKIYLFTPEDIERMVAYYKHKNEPKDFVGPVTKVGRRRVFSDEERLERARLHSQANYWKTKIKRTEDQEVKDHAEKKLDEVRRKLDEL